jgi:hypothetical protein
MTAYRKFVVALVGFLVVIAHNQGVDIAEDVSNALITLLTALGVFVVPND